MFSFNLPSAFKRLKLIFMPRQIYSSDDTSNRTWTCVSSVECDRQAATRKWLREAARRHSPPSAQVTRFRKAHHLAFFDLVP